MSSQEPLRNPLAVTDETASGSASQTRGLRGPTAGASSGRGLSLGTPRGGLALGVPRGGLTCGAAGSGASSSSSSSSVPPLRQRTADAAIRGTDNDAVGARLSAIEQGYIAGDPYTRLLAPHTQARPQQQQQLSARRPPIINIGTYLRCRAIDTLVARFLDAPSASASGKQIISLGAGSDARYWRLEHDPHLRSRLRHYVEIDFPEVTSAKIERITRHDALAKVLSASNDGSGIEISQDRAALHSSRYTLLAANLRSVPCESVSERPAETHVRACLEEALDPEADTLILAECVLAYMSPSQSNSLLDYLGRTLKRPFAICYEMCVAGDGKDLHVDAPPSRFGSVMLANLKTRNLDMPGSHHFSTLSSHAQRFEKAWPGANGHGTAVSLKHVWLGLDEQERQRLSRLEGLDEVEELEMLLAHYAISWYASDASKHASFFSTSL